MNIDANKVCGACLARLRKEAGLTQTALAKTLGTPQSYVSKIENGERSLKAYEQVEYARALGISSARLAESLESALESGGLVGRGVFRS